jgi:hypothetical protein
MAKQTRTILMLRFKSWILQCLRIFDSEGVFSLLLKQELAPSESKKLE